MQIALSAHYLFPYQLSGLVFCKKCGDRMVGKSAHGATCKVGYYEHASNTVPGAHVPELQRTCFPIRVQAKLLEPALWNEIMNLFSEEKFAQELLNSAKRAHLHNPGSKEAEKYNHIVFNVDRQLEVLAERLSSLPQSISPTPVYKQMEKLEEKKKEAQSKLAKMQSEGVIKDEPCELQDFQRFLKAVSEILRRDDNLKIRQRVIRLLVHKINIIPDGFEVHFKVGESYVKIFLIRHESGKIQEKKVQLNSSLKGSESTLAPPSSGAFDASQFLGHFSSNTCQSGAQVEQVDEHPGPFTTFIFEMESYPEAKSLIGTEIKALYRKFRSWPQVAEIVGSSESFVRQNASRRKQLAKV